MPPPSPAAARRGGVSTGTNASPAGKKRPSVPADTTTKAAASPELKAVAAAAVAYAGEKNLPLQAHADKVVADIEAKRAGVAAHQQAKKDAKAGAIAARRSTYPPGQQPPARSQSCSALLGDLNTDLGEIYRNTVSAFAPDARRLPAPTVLRTPENATLMFRVPNKREAIKLFKRLDRTTVYGRKWRAHYAPQSAVTPSTSPTVVDVTVAPAGMPIDTLEGVLGTMPGLLAVTAGASPTEFLATFGDEGSAIHAKAVLSGRQQSGGAHLFLALRKSEVEEDDEAEDDASDSDDAVVAKDE